MRQKITEVIAPGAARGSTCGGEPEFIDMVLRRAIGGVCFATRTAGCSHHQQPLCASADLYGDVRPQAMTVEADVLRFDRQTGEGHGVTGPATRLWSFVRPGE